MSPKSTLIIMTKDRSGYIRTKVDIQIGTNDQSG